MGDPRAGLPNPPRQRPAAPHDDVLDTGRRAALREATEQLPARSAVA
ncbi:hypothetical protein ACFYOV_06250 [Streptomyces sp. NPDC005931]